MTSAEKALRDALVLKTPGGNKNYSVVAGAGAGKSTMLSKRISRQVMNGEDPESFVIITYTNAAANELRDKIAEGLSAMLSDPGVIGKEKENVEKALDRLELIRISTIHSFLLQILREHSFESGLALDAVMLEGDEEKGRKQRFFDRWYEEHFSEIQAYYSDWTVTTKEGKPNNHLRSALLGVFCDIASVREQIVIDTADHTADIENKAREYVDKYLPAFLRFDKVMMANRPRKKDETPAKLNKDPAAIDDIVRSVEAETKTGSYGIEEAKLLSDAFISLKARIDAKMKDSEQGFYGKNTDDRALDGLYPTMSENELEWNFRRYYDEYLIWSQRAALLTEYADKMKTAYQKEADEDTRVISNDDILWRSEQLLTKNSALLEELRAKYSKIYVDEFQDTTGRQARIIKLLSGKAGSALSPFEPEENKLFLVGDPKQSIYRFTGAEKTVYDRVNAEFKGMDPFLGESRVLSENFRSNKDIVDWVNDRFAKLMPGSYSSMDSEWNVKKISSLHGVFRYAASGEEGEKYTAQKDAAAVTGLIRDLVDSDHCFLEEFRRKDSSYHLRRIQYSDFMVITRNTMDMLSYVEAFSAAGIPLNVQGKMDFSGDEVVWNFIRLLNAFSDEKNKGIRIAAEQIAVRTDLAMEDSTTGLKVGNDRLKTLKDAFRKGHLGSASIVRRLLKEEDLYLPAGTFDNLRVRQYRSRLHQVVEACLTENTGDLSQLVATMRTYVTGEIKQGLSLESEDNAVRLMNVHKAKGLTGKIVIIANRKDSEEARYGGFKSGDKYYPAVSYKVSEAYGTITRPAFAWNKALMEKACKEEKEETTRLEYVAVTRAAHATIFMPIVRDGKGSINNHIWFTNAKYQIDELPEIGKWIKDRNADSGVPFLTAKASAVAPAVRLWDLEQNEKKADRDSIGTPVSDSISPSLLERGGITGNPSTEADAFDAGRPKGNVFGTVMHRVYELIVRRFKELKDADKIARADAIRRIINQAVSEQLREMSKSDDPETFFTYLNDKMNVYFEKVIVPIVEPADEVYPEFSFSFYVPKEEVKAFRDQFGTVMEGCGGHAEIRTDCIWVNGQADLVVKKGDSVKVYDYKSDTRNGKPIEDFEKALEDKYKGQLELYKYAIGKVFEVTAVDAEIIHLYRE